jgi:hypothetical protein
VSYYEASLVSMSALSNIGVVFLAFAALFFAPREGTAAAVATLAFGALAAAAQASGLFALPLAAAVCALGGRRKRAIAAAAFALLVWAAYFVGYVRPVGHPSVFTALTHPLETIRLFFIIVGGVAPNRTYAVAVGLALLVAIGWALRRGLWRVSPAMAGWIAFILVSAAATAVARVGFGVFHASRYALQSSCLAMLALLAIAVLVRPMTARQAFKTAAAGAVASLVILVATWPHVSGYSYRARVLAKGVPASPEVRTDTYFGVLYPDRARSDALLAQARQRGLWSAREQSVMPTTVRVAPMPVQEAPAAGVLERVVQEGARLRISGWSHIPATLPGRTLTLSGAADPVRVALAVQDRLDVAEHTGVPALVFSGFALEADYASAAEAGRAARSLCVIASGPEHEPRRLAASPGCPAR